jgi:serine phosphatase RsbU (regulator of sigma subunit)
VQTDQEHTQVVTFARNIDVALEARLHCLELMDGFDAGRRHIVGRAGTSIGRTAPAQIILTDSEVSRTHCRLAIEGGQLMVTDLKSTNGTFVDGVRVEGPTALPVGAVLRVGRQSLKHEWRTHREIQQSEELDRDLAKANSYVQALLPAMNADGPIRSDWVYQPCAKLGGDAFGYGVISDTKFAVYLIDVSGHGAGAAMHSVAVMNLLRQRAFLPGTDLSQPAQVLTALNAMFPMDINAGMYFTMWYGVYDKITRRLDFASAGHHPAYLVAADRSAAVPLKTRNVMIGTMPDTTYRSDSTEIPPGASLYLFSDGVFEIVTIDGVEWSLGDFIPALTKPPVEGLSEAKRLLAEVNRVARPGGLDDDFSLVVLTFD